jgi:hypothetical protein
MSAIEGPKENNSNLVLELDANNIKSISPNRFYAYGTVGEGRRADNNVTFAVQGTGTFQRLGYNQEFGGYTIKESDVVYRYMLGGSGCHYHGNIIYVPQGAYVAYKYDYYISEDAEDYGIAGNNLYLANAENNGAGTGMENYAPNLNKGVWQTMSGNFGPASSSGNINFYLYPGACSPDARINRLAKNGFILYKNPQVEIVYSSIATVSPTFTYNNLTSTFKNAIFAGHDANVYGTIPYEIDVVPCFNFAQVTSSIGSGNVAPGASAGFTLQSNPVPVNGSFTISTWLKNPNGAGQLGLFANAGGADGYRFGPSNTSLYYLIGSTSGTYKENYISYLSTLSASLWYNVVGVFDKTNNLVSCYVNGVLQGSDSIPNLTELPFSSIAPGIVRSGCCSLYTGKLANLSVYDTALSASVILSNFEANRSRYGI